jgi:hypothetical protein
MQRLGLLRGTAPQLGWQGQAMDWGVAIDAAVAQIAALVAESGWAAHLERSMDR